MQQPIANKPIFLKIVFLLLVIVITTVGARFGFRYFYRSAYPVHYSSFVQQYSEDNGLAQSLVYAVIRTESGFDPYASSSVDARGLMQITEDTFYWLQYRENEPDTLDISMLYDSALNIRYGTALLRLHLQEFGSVEVALCAYHAGRGNVNKWLADPALSKDGVNLDKIPFADTAYYVERVINTQEMYERLYEFD